MTVSCLFTQDHTLCLQCGRPRFDPLVGKIPWRRKWQPTPVLLPGKSHGWRSLVGYSPRGHKELDTTEWLHFHFHTLCILVSGSYMGSAGFCLSTCGSFPEPLKLEMVDISKGYRQPCSKWLSSREATCQCRGRGFNPSVRKMAWSRKGHPTPVLLPGKSHGRRSLVGYSPRGPKSQAQLSG